MKSFILGCIYAILSVGLGAMGEHMLKDHLIEKDLNTLNTATTYLFYIAVPLLMIGMTQRLVRWPSICGGLFALSGCLFSGSLIAYVATKNVGFVYITPIGGVLLMISWLIFCIVGVRALNQ